MINLLFWANLILVYLMLVGTIYSIVRPNHRIRPPPDNKSLQYYGTWILFDLSVVINIALAFSSWDTWIVPFEVRLFIGITIILLGSILVSWGMKTLGMNNTFGEAKGLKTTGAYQITRNPQYLGDIILYIGLILLVNSLYVAIILILKIVIFILAPIAEESWLDEKYGDDYREYTKGVQRFL